MMYAKLFLEGSIKERLAEIKEHISKIKGYLDDNMNLHSDGFWSLKPLETVRAHQGIDENIWYIQDITIIYPIHNLYIFVALMNEIVNNTCNNHAKQFIRMSLCRWWLCYYAENS